jgi:hypothetical protein
MSRVLDFGLGIRALNLCGRALEAVERCRSHGVVSFHRILGTPVGRVLLAAAIGFTAVGAVQSLRSIIAAGALVALGSLWIALGTLDQRTAAHLVKCEDDLEQAFAARADVTVLLGAGWLVAGWFGLVNAAITATG